MQTPEFTPTWIIAFSVAVPAVTGTIFLLKRLMGNSGGQNPKNDTAAGRERAVGDLKGHITEARDTINENIDDTRHTLAGPLTALSLALPGIVQTLGEIRDRLPEKRRRR